MELTIQIDDADTALIQAAADRELRTLPAFIVYAAKLRARKPMTMHGAHERRKRAALEA